MKLLIITQKVNSDDPILGFFHRWIEGFAADCESVIVICLEKGTYSLPHNVKVLSLGKESGASRVTQASRFFSYIWRERRNYDAVFVHMNPIYVVLAGPLWRAMKKKITMWYTHKAVDLKLRIAEKFVHRIFTAAQESFRLPSLKVVVTGHGIDVDIFACSEHATGSVPHIIHVGRVTKIKNCDILIEAIRILVQEMHVSCSLSFIGEPVTASDLVYKRGLEEKIDRYDLRKVIVFSGSVLPKSLVGSYCASDISVNLTPTGGLDKAVLESMSCGVPVFTSNQAFKNYFGPYAERLMFEVGNAQELADKLHDFIMATDKDDVALFMRNRAITSASIDRLIQNIVSEISHL